MDLGPVFFVLIVLIKVANSINEDDYFYNDRNLGQNNNIAPSYNSQRTSYDASLAPRYEVTEHVIDIPDDRQPKIPIVTNYTLTKPLNNVTSAVGNSGDKKPSKHNKNNRQDGNKESNYHSVHEIEKNKHASKKIHKIHEESFTSKEELIHGTKNSLTEGLQTGLLEKVLNKVNKILNINNVLETPVRVLNKLHKKSEISAKRLHKTIFEEEFGDYNDDFF